MRTVGDVSDTLNSELNRLLHSNTINTPDMRKELYSTIRSVIGDVNDNQVAVSVTEMTWKDLYPSTFERVLAHLTHVLINLKVLKSCYTVPKWFCFILPYRIKNRLRIRDYSEIEALLSNYSSADDTDNLIEELVEVLDTDFYAEFSTPEHTYVCNITFVPLVPAEYTDVKLSLSR